MKRKTLTKVLTALIVVLLLALTLGISWISTCGIIKAITWCFGWEFSWKVATGVWFVVLLAQSVFKSNVNVKK